VNEQRLGETESATEELERFGYNEELKQGFTLWSVFALAFISPIVALYAIFGQASAVGGAAFWRGFLVALVSQGSIEGSVYQWSRRLLGKGHGWFTGR